MSLSRNTQELLSMALSAVRSEGFGVFGCYIKYDPLEIVHFADPPQSRKAMCNLVDEWLSVLRDDSVDTEVVEDGPDIKLTDA